MRIFLTSLVACMIPLMALAEEPPMKDLEGRPNPPKTREEAIKRAENYTNNLKKMTDAEWEEKHKERIERRVKEREQRHQRDISGTSSSVSSSDAGVTSKPKAWHQKTPEERKEARRELMERHKQRQQEKRDMIQDDSADLEPTP